MIYERRHTRQIADLNGLQKVAPWLAGIFTVVMLSARSACPASTGSSASSWSSSAPSSPIAGRRSAATAGVILAALYLLWAYQRVFHGEPTGDNATMGDIGWQGPGVMLPLLAVIVFLGVYPKPVLNRIQPSVNAVLAHVSDVTGYRQPAVARTRASAVAGGRPSRSLAADLPAAACQPPQISK